MNNILYSVDEYGVKNYHNMPILGVALAFFFVVIYAAAHILLHFEVGAETANVTNFVDAFWLCFMAASTIGFGDFYPVTAGGRTVIGSMFILGGVMLGTIIGLVGNMVMGFMDTNVKNRELRLQLQELMEHNEQVELASTHLMRQLNESHKMNEDMFSHNKAIETKLDILMKHVDKTTPELKMESTS